MASQPYRPDVLPATTRPLPFMTTSFSAAEAGTALPVSGSFAASYPPPPSFGGGSGFGQQHGGFGAPGGFSAAASAYGGGAHSFEDEPPLLEGAWGRAAASSTASPTLTRRGGAPELGIDLPHILRKTRSMLRPFRADPALCDDGDLSGPLVFAFALGSCHLLMGKVNFGYIIGWSVLSMLALNWLVNMLAGAAQGVELYRCGSLLGYCLLPIVLFSALAVLLPARSVAVYALGALATLWATSTASGLLTAIVPALEGQRLLVAYPCALVYGLFALLTVG